MANEKIKQIKLGNTNYDIEPYLTQELTITSNNPSLNWGQTSTIGTIGETEFKVTMPERPGSTTDKYHTSGSWSGLTYTATSNGGAGTLSFTIPTGTSSTTVAKGNHTHNYLPLSGGGTISDSSTDQTTKIGAQEVTISSSMLAVSTGLTYNAIKHTINGSTYNFSFPEKGGRIALSSDTVNLTGNQTIGGFKKFTNSLSTTAYCDDDTYTQVWIYTDCINASDGDWDYFYYFPKKDGTLVVADNGNVTLTGTLQANVLKSDETEAALQFSHSNEVSFGSNGDTIYLGYQNRIGSSGYVSKYNFGCSNGDAGARGGTIYCGEVYVDNGVTKVAREGHTHSYAPTSASSTAGTSQKTGATLYLVGALSKDSSTSTTYINPGVYINTSNQVEASGFYATSDKRLKTNIEDYTCSKSILDLPIKKFEFINKPGQVNIGCIAQDLQEICPEIVNTNEDGYLSINEGKIVYLLLEEVKKLRQELNELKRG